MNDKTKQVLLLFAALEIAVEDLRSEACDKDKETVDRASAGLYRVQKLLDEVL